MLFGHKRNEVLMLTAIRISLENVLRNIYYLEQIYWIEGGPDGECVTG